VTFCQPLSISYGIFCSHGKLHVAGYIPIRTPARKLTATPTPIAGTPAGFFIQQEDRSAKYMDNQPKGNLPFMKPEDAQYFDKLLVRYFTVYMVDR
jgi:hypothetical protein